MSPFTEPPVEENGELSFNIDLSNAKELAYTIATVHVELINLSDPADTRVDDLVFDPNT